MDSVNMKVSGIVSQKDKRIVHVSFTRGKDFAEGILPDCKIRRAGGFCGAEIRRLEAYMKENQSEIMKQASQVDPMKNWLGTWK